MRLIILDDAEVVGEWAAKYVLKRVRDFNPGPNKWALFPIYYYYFFICVVELSKNFNQLYET